MPLRHREGFAVRLETCIRSDPVDRAMCAEEGSAESREGSRTRRWERRKEHKAKGTQRTEEHPRKQAHAPTRDAGVHGCASGRPSTPPQVPRFRRKEGMVGTVEPIPRNPKPGRRDPWNQHWTGHRFQTFPFPGFEAPWFSRRPYPDASPFRISGSNPRHRPLEHPNGSSPVPSIDRPGSFVRVKGEDRDGKGVGSPRAMHSWRDCWIASDAPPWKKLRKPWKLCTCKRRCRK